MSQISTPTVAVIGAGIAGLASARHLLDQAHASGKQIQVMILEKANRAGGNIRTERDGGYVCEWGPEGFLDNTPETLELARRVGLGEELIRANADAAHRFILRAGKLREVPLSPPAFLFSDLLPLGPRLRVLMEPFVPPKRDDADESVFDFAARRIGCDAAAHLVDAMVSGVYAGDARQISLRSAFPKMYAMERQYGGLVKAMIARQREARRTGQAIGGPSGPRGTLTSFGAGMERLVEALAQSFDPGVVRLSCGVKALERDGATWKLNLDNGEMIEAQAVVFSTPAPVTAELVAIASPDLSQQLARIPFASIAVLGLGYRREQVAHSLNGFGYLVPHCERQQTLGVLWSSSTFANRAPNGHVLLRAMIGGATNPQAVDWSEEQLLDVCRREINPLLGISGEPAWHRVFRYRRGIAQYVVGHEELLNKTRQTLNDLPGIFLTGTSYQGIAVNSTCQAAPRLASALIEALNHASPAERIF